MAYLTVAMTMIAVGFVLFTWGIDRMDDLARNAGAIIIGISIIMWVGALRITKREQEEQRERGKRLIAIIEAIARKMGVDVDKLNNKGERTWRQGRGSCV